MKKILKITSTLKKEKKKIDVYLIRYPPIIRIIIKNAIKGFEFGRKSSTISLGRLQKEFEYWNKYPIWQVIGGLIIYNNKQYYKENKFEKYARGIIRNVTIEQLEELSLFNSEILLTLFKQLKINTLDKCNKCSDGHIINSIEGNIIVSTCDCLKKYKKQKAKILYYNNHWLEICKDKKRI